MIYAKQANGTVDQVSAKLEAAVVANKFGVLGVHNLKEKLAAKGVALEPECRVFEVCNPMQAKRVLERNMSIANALPCRICVYEEAGSVMISTLKPTALIALFGESGLQNVAGEVEASLIHIIDEACG